MDNKRTILAFALVFIIFGISNFLFTKKQPPRQAPKQVAQTTTIPQQETPKQQPQKPVNPALVMPDSTLVQVNENIIIQNSTLRLRLTNVGARIAGAELIEKAADGSYKYADSLGNPVQLIPQSQSAYALGGMQVYEKSASAPALLDDAVFEYSPILGSEGTMGYEFVLKTAQGEVAKKRIMLTKGYQVEFAVSLEDWPTQVSGYDLLLNSGIADTERDTKYKTTDYKTVLQLDGETKSETLASLKKEQENYEGKIDWVAVRSKYFVLGVLPQSSIPVTGVTAYSINSSPAANLSIRVAQGTIYDNTFTMYLGPAIYDELKAMGQGFQNSAELGWSLLRPISTLFIRFFALLHRVIPNYGVDILILALVLNIVLYPLTHKSQKSMQKMQQLQPHLSEINRKHKDDPQKRLEQTRLLYAEHGANPLSGCLPLLLQMPVFFALYPVLRYSVALRGASFVGWLQDLSVPDPYFVMPILMAVFMFVQQRYMRPAQPITDDMDEKAKAAAQSNKLMGYMMPVVMFFIFRNMPSGLVLYWTFFNVLSISQQLYRKVKSKQEA